MRSQAATPLIEAKTSCPHDDHHDDDDDCVFLEPDDDGEFEFLPPGDRIRSDAADVVLRWQKNVVKGCVSRGLITQPVTMFLCPAEYT